MAVGDAGGLVDPITGEGIYYAMRSADLASQTLLSDAHAPAGKHRAYRSLLMRDFAAELAFGAAIAPRFFLGKFLFGSVTQRMVQFLRRSPRLRDLTQELFAGTLSYLGLKARLLRSLEGTMLDTFMSFLSSHGEAAKEGQA
jgi:flavin-dependent dehydrogenase